MDDAEIKGPPKDNAVLGHIIHRLFNIVSPPEVSESSFDSPFVHDC